MGLLRWALLFAILAILAAVFGFTPIAEGFADIAKILFLLFVAIVVAIVILGLVGFRAVSP